MRNGMIYVILAVTALTYLFYPSASDGQEYEFVEQWPEKILGLRSPQDVAVDDSGNVYVADTYNRIQKFDSEGNFLTKWGARGEGNGQFSSLSGIAGMAVDGSGNVYVTDRGYNRIQKFDSEGNFLTKWGTGGSGDGQFDYLSDVAVDGLANVYVADTRNHRIQKFRPVVVSAVGPEEKLAVPLGSIKERSELSANFALKQNYPNPFNPETWIPYQLAEDSEVTIRIYSATGQVIRLLNLGYREAGLYATKDAAAYWDGTTDTGEYVSSGVYFYNIQAGRYNTTKKMTVAR